MEDFRVHRAYAHSSLFAFMNRYESEGTCSGPLMEICLKEKIEFRKWNQTHLMIKIFDVTVNDRGLYEVSARFKGLQSDEWTMKCLQVIHLEKKDHGQLRTTAPLQLRALDHSQLKTTVPLQ